MIKNHTIGADIEAFFINKQTGEFVSAEGIVPGTKYEPFIFDESNKYYAVSLDNVAAEFCIPPTTKVENYIHSIYHAREFLNSIRADLELAFVPCTRFDKKYLTTQNAKTLGCEPDFNAWMNGQQNVPPNGKKTDLRTAGFHVHIGYDNPTEETNIKLMQFFDAYVTLPALLIEPENERRQLYGKAGSFRHKEYGMESRTLSSFFASSPELIKWVFNQTEIAINQANKQERIGWYITDNLPKWIAEGNVEAAKEMVEELDIKLIMSA